MTLIAVVIGILVLNILFFGTLSVIFAIERRKHDDHGKRTDRKV